MKTKRYSADTLREALEKVKQELGEEALVLDSRPVRVGGLLGIGGKEQIEVRVSAETPAAQRAPEKSITRLPSRYTSLILNDDVPVAPQPRVSGTATLFANLAARAYSEEARQMQSVAPVAVEPETEPVVPALPTAKVKTTTVEAEPARAAAVQKAGPVNPDGVVAELGRVHAELRELKFAFKGMTNQNRSFSAPHNAEWADGEIYDSPYYETYLELTSSGLDSDLARQITRELITSGLTASNPHDLARLALRKSLPALVNFAKDPLETVEGAENRSVIALVGPTGVGKTTTIAKLSARVALRERQRVELITLDTYRIAAVEQLRTYAEIIGAGFHVPGSILELDALVRRFSDKATIMIDTVGRGPRDLGDQLEVADYLRRSENIIKCVAIQATTHPSDAHDAINRYTLFGPNALIFTKLDEASRPGSIVTSAAESGLPLLYLCNGQRVPEDIDKISLDSLVNHILPTRPKALVSVA